MDFIGTYREIREIWETAKDAKELGKKIMEFIQRKPIPLADTEQDQASVVSRALHRLQKGVAPHIAIVGATSAGKTMLVNKLFGDPVAEVRRTPDTTGEVLRVEFPSGLVIYDTPGIISDEKLENFTRLFLGLEQTDAPDVERVESVPFKAHPGSDPILLPMGECRMKAPIDMVLWAVDVSQTPLKPTKQVLHSFFIELYHEFGERIVVAGTHLDELNKVSDEEKSSLLRIWSNIFNKQMIPISSTTGENLKDLSLALFERLPGKTSLAKMQESLNQVVKIDRISFVVTEVSQVLADIALMRGNEEEDIQVSLVMLFAMIGNHYSVSEETWVQLSGDALAIAEHVQEFGEIRVKVSREPEGFWETIRSWFSDKPFLAIITRFQPLGVEGLSHLVPKVYALIHQFERSDAGVLPDELVQQRVESEKEMFEPLMQDEKRDKLADKINELFKSLFLLD